MRKFIVAGNWKMNGSKAHTQSLLSDVKAKALEFSEVEVLVFPPYLYLDQVETLLSGTCIKWGAQNLDQHDNGAFTGEVSAEMLLEFGCTHVLIGHSERRSLYHESIELTTEKYRHALNAGLTPIFCIGETIEERNKGLTYDVLSAQLEGLLVSDQSIQALESAVIAYEPVWAIGTGLTASPEMAQEVHGKIRSWINERDKTIADKVRILYGGSVKPDNAKALFDMPDIDGGLIGGASLKAHDFLEIIKSCYNS